jgi:hypothetical protein
MIAVVKLDDSRYGAGPGTVLEVTSDPILEVCKRYMDRDGAIREDLRFWRASENTVRGERVIAGQ